MQAPFNRQWPADAGYRMPAEWSPHCATWLSWPHNEDTWPGRFGRVEPAMARLVQALLEGEAVYINVLSAAHRAAVAAVLADAGVRDGQVRFFEVPTNDAWCRDHGAIFVTRNGTKPLAAVDCEYNAWGGKYPPWDLDAQVAAHMAELLGVPRFAGDFVLEGGSVDVNGAGALLTTEQCLLNPNRNPSLDQAEIEQRLRRLLGVEQIIWLGDGIVGDDTDGHVDDLCRFVGPRTVVTVTESDPADDNYRALAENLERLRAVRLADGQGLEIIELPMPAPLSIGGQRVPASYANFYIANRAVLLPVFDDPQDEIAARRLQACFPDRRVVPIDCRDLVWGLGAIHCLTQQVPATAIAGAHNVL